MDDPRQMKFPFGKKPQTPPPNIDNILKIVAAKIEDMKSQIDKEMDDRDIEEALEAMGMDPESIKEIIDDDDVDVDVEMIDNKNRKDYGESFMDWSPKLDDYLT
jgi:alanyl-tRNA synthetase